MSTLDWSPVSLTLLEECADWIYQQIEEEKKYLLELITQITPS